MSDKKLLKYHQDQLLMIALAINPDYPLGSGMIAQIKTHQKIIFELEQKLLEK